MTKLLFQPLCPWSSPNYSCYCSQANPCSDETFWFLVYLKSLRGSLPLKVLLCHLQAWVLILSVDSEGLHWMPPAWFSAFSPPVLSAGRFTCHGSPLGDSACPSPWFCCELWSEIRDWHFLVHFSISNTWHMTLLKTLNRAVSKQWNF